jgi:NTE family protein
MTSISCDENISSVGTPTPEAYTTEASLTAVVKNVAIACQGGGSHTAFTAGVLAELVPELSALDRRLVGISGTSGGAVSATTAWYHYLADGPEAVPRAMESLWAALAARTPAERWANDALVFGSRLQTTGAPVPSFSPYVTPVADFGQRFLREVIEDHIDFERFPDLVDETAPRLVVGTVDINGGCFEAFEDEAVTTDVLLASAAVPDLFEAVEMNGHWHWDGLFSQNPPIHELMTVAPKRKPDELWVVQINPQTREGEPKSLLEIADRRNELSGNISLNQELRFLERVNDWIEAGYLPEERYTHTEVHRIEFGQELSCSSKLDRSVDFVEELLNRGRAAAQEFRTGLD